MIPSRSSNDNGDSKEEAVMLRAVIVLGLLALIGLLYLGIDPAITQLHEQLSGQLGSDNASTAGQTAIDRAYQVWTAVPFAMLLLGVIWVFADAVRESGG